MSNFDTAVPARLFDTHIPTVLLQASMVPPTPCPPPPHPGEQQAADPPSHAARRTHPARNLGAAKALTDPIARAPACTATIAGTPPGERDVQEGVTCLSPGATIVGQVTVAPGASLMASKATVTGGVTATGASTIELVGVSVTGSGRLSGSIARITVFGSTIGGDLSVAANKTPKLPTLVGNSVKGQK